MKKEVLANVLILDETSESLNHLQSIFNDQQLKVFSTQHRYEALKLLSLHKPQILLADLGAQHGKLNWIADVKEKNADLIIFILSDGKNAAFAEKAQNIGIDGVINKPFHVGDILGNIYSVIYRQTMAVTAA